MCTDTTPDGLAGPRSALDDTLMATVEVVEDFWSHAVGNDDSLASEKQLSFVELLSVLAFAVIRCLPGTCAQC